MLLKLEDATSGKIVVGGKDLASVTGKELFNLRSRMQPVFQDPYGSLNPLRNIGNTISEPLFTHKVGTKASRRERVLRAARPGVAAAVRSSAGTRTSSRAASASASRSRVRSR